MANYFPLIANPVGNIIQELPADSFLDLSQSGIANSGNITVSGVVSVTGTVTGGNIATGGTISATGNITGGNIRTANITIGADTIKSANSTLTIDPSADGATGLVVIAGNLQVTGTTTTVDSTTVTINDLMINVANNAATAAAANGGGLGVGPVGAEYIKLYYDQAGNTWDSTHGISAVGTITATQFTGSGAGLTSIPGGNVTGTVPSATSATSATTAGTVTTAAQPNITSVGTLSSLSVTGNVTSSTGHVGTMYTNSIINTGANLTGNIGSSTLYFNTAFVKATSAQYADLAENYLADADYEPGTVLSFGGNNEVTVSNQANDRRVAGVVTTNPSYTMNAGLTGDHVVGIALIGRVPTRVVGTVRKGDFMVSAGNGHAQACAEPKLGTVIGKAIEDFDGESGVIEILINNQ